MEVCCCGGDARGHEPCEKEDARCLPDDQYYLDPESFNYWYPFGDEAAALDMPSWILAVLYAWVRDSECVTAQCEFCHHVCGNEIPHRCQKYYRVDQDWIAANVGEEPNLPPSSIGAYPLPGQVQNPENDKKKCIDLITKALDKIKEVIYNRVDPCNCILSQVIYDRIYAGLMWYLTGILPCLAKSDYGGECKGCGKKGKARPYAFHSDVTNHIYICCYNLFKPYDPQGELCAFIHTIAHELGHAGGIGTQTIIHDRLEHETGSWTRCICPPTVSPGGSSSMRAGAGSAGRGGGCC
jgi:hypothetical protein